MPEVASAEVDFPAKTATVVSRAGKTIDRAAVEEVLKDKGYEVTSFAETAATSSDP